MMRSWAYNRLGVLMGTSWSVSCPHWHGLRDNSLPMITPFLSQGGFCATAAGRIAHEGHEKQLQGLQPSQRLSQGLGLWRVLSFFRLQVCEGLQAPLCLATRAEKSAFGSGFRGQQKGKARLLKTVANPCTQALKLLKEGQLGIVMFQGVGDNMAHIADPRGPIGGLQ